MSLKEPQIKTSNLRERDRVFHQIEQAVKVGQRFLVVSHIDPDGDALGTQLAFGAYLKSLGKDVIMAGSSTIPEKYRFLPGIELISEVASLPEKTAVDTIVILECPSPERIGEARKFIMPETTVINIDHHQDSLMLGKINWIDKSASSVGEMVYEYFKATGFMPDADLATQLYTAILTDTGRFRFSSTSPRTMQIAGELIDAGADPHAITDSVYYSMPPSSLKLLGKVLNSIEYYSNNQICILTLTRKMLAEAEADVSESDGLVDFTLFTKGVVTGALIKELDDHICKVSLRSVDGVDVARIAAAYAGGGHVNAAGCVIPLPLDEAKSELLRQLEEASHHA